MILIRNCDVYAPEKLGKKDILLAGNTIVAVDDNIPPDFPHLTEIINGEGLILTPGIIDAHVHIAGAGGEGGPATRTPELKLSDMIRAGVTSVVGCLGTDGITRSMESVLMKVKSLRQEGVSAWMYTGAYQVPTPTLLGDVARDIALIDEVIGAGEIALSDHRSSHPSVNELIRLVSQARVGGMLGGKAGIVNIHMGDAQNPFQPIYDAVAKSELPLTQFFPTHCNRNDHIFEDSKTYGKEGYIDLTTSSYPYFPEYEIKPSKALVELLNAKVPVEHITMTSDACGSLPHFDDNGELVKLEMGYPNATLREIKDAVIEEKLPPETVLKTVTSNVADRLKLKMKGRIRSGADADLILLDKNWNLQYVMALGAWMMKAGTLVRKGSYEG
jgi:beta-aspartyl-dipeptidase (metallo-type)